MHLFESLYYLGLSAKQFYSVKHQRRLPCRVISIGNITVGGTGKTPAAIALAQEAQKRGMKPMILTRGYRGTARGPCFVTKGEGPLLSFLEAGDEPVLMAEKLNGVPIVKCACRFKAGAFALRELGIREADLSSHIFILDDGFQHRSLYRDKDIVLIDSGDPFGNGRLLPFGRLREPVKSLMRADIIVIAKTGERVGQGEDALKEKIRGYNAASKLFLSAHTPISCELAAGGEMPMDWLSGNSVFGFCALGSPESFRKTLLASGAYLCGFRAYRDHYRFNNEDIRRIKTEAGQSGAKWIVTTEKDIIRARKLDLPDNIAVLKIAFAVEDGFYDSIFNL